MKLIPLAIVLFLLVLGAVYVGSADDHGPLGADRLPTLAELEAANPVRALPGELVGHDMLLTDIAQPPDPHRARLGRFLFYDTRLSADGSISCATCHRPEFGFSEPTPVSTGIDGQMGGRKAPSVVNAAFAIYPETFWDGRAASLEEQAVGPIENPIEMGDTHEAVVARIAAVEQYGHFFADAFGDPQVTLDRIASALADYERTLISHNSRYDQWRDGDDEEPGWVDPLSAQEHRGRELFFGKALCATCHVGTSFTDSRYHNLGIGWDPANEGFADEGRFAITGEDVDLGAFKTPGLRETHLHPPYMHDGSLATLEDVVDHYVQGGTPNPWLSPKMKPLDLDEAEQAALVAFMESLAGEGWQDTPPALFPR